MIINKHETHMSTIIILSMTIINQYVYKCVWIINYTVVVILFKKLLIYMIIMLQNVYLST